MRLDILVRVLLNDPKDGVCVRPPTDRPRPPAALPGGSSEVVERATNADIVASSLDVNGTLICIYACCSDLNFYLVLSEKFLITLAHLEKVAHDISSGTITPTRQVAEDFQPKLGALIAFTGGGVLRPGSVPGLFLRTLSCHLFQSEMHPSCILNRERDGSNPKATR